MIIKLYLNLKYYFNFFIGNIGSLSSELLFIKQNYNKLNDNVAKNLLENITYKQDKFNGTQWDWQFDAKKTIKRGGGDCNSIHRVWQVYFHNQGYESFLASYHANPFSKSHTFCIFKDKKTKKIYSCDYGDIIERTSTNKAFQEVSKTYNSTVVSSALQDIRWRVI